MAQIIDSCCVTISLRRGTFIILILYLIISNIYLVTDVYHYLWEVSKTSSSPEAILLILFVKYSIYVLAIVTALFGLCLKKAEFLIPAILIRIIIVIEDAIDLISYIFRKRTIIPTSLPIFYTEDYLVEIAFGAVLLGVSSYFIVVIYSYYEELREKSSKLSDLPDEAENPVMDIHLSSTIRKT